MGRQAFTTAGAFTFNVPAGVALVYVTLVAGGGGGQGGGGDVTAGLGGGCGEYGLRVPYAVTPSGTVSGSVGAAGAGRVGKLTGGSDGGNTTFGTLTVLGGGLNGRGGNNHDPIPIGNQAATYGSLDGPVWFTGSGGPGQNGNDPAQPGLGAAGVPPNPSGSVTLGIGFGSVAASCTPFGKGAQGANGGDNGATPDPTAYGVGGVGGGGSTSGTTNGGPGGGGYVLVEW